MSIATPDIRARTRQLANPTNANYTATAGLVGPLDAGWYQLSASTDAYILQGASDVVADSTSNPLWSKQFVKVYVGDDVDDTDAYISAVQQSSGGTLFVTKLE